MQRCTLHKRRNVADHLPDKDKAWVDAKLVKAFVHPDPDQGLRRVKDLAGLLVNSHPGAAASLLEGWRRCSPSPAWASTAAWPRP